MNSFGKEHRLLSKKDFSNLRVGSFKKGREVVLCYFKKNNLNESRIGISVSKKIANACKRNRVKRMIKETFRTSLFKNQSVDILFVIKKNKMGIDFKKIVTETQYLLKKVTKSDN